MMRVHFIAIGGSAMHNLALALHEKGDQVTGSDDEVFEPSKSRLHAAGLLPEKMGWDASRISSQLDAVVLGMHARADNPELLRAQELNIPIYSYPEFLFNQSQSKTRVVIAGSHGKTTITSMVLHVAGYHGVDLDFMVGAQLAGFNTMVRITKDAEFMLLEGDEYLSSPLDLRSKFLWYKPHIALVSGIAWDHVNVFKTEDAYVDTFRQFVASIEDGGILVYSQEDAKVDALVNSMEHPTRKIPYTTPSYRVAGDHTILETPDGEVQLQIFGGHNLQNLEGARLVCNQLGIMDEQFYEAIASFKGANKRLESLGSIPGRVVYKDFAHAPSKVTATTRAVKEQYPNRTVVACLELHTFSSLNPEFIGHYAGSLNPADVAMVYFNPQVVAHKKLPALSVEQVQEKFGRTDLRVFTQAEEVLKALQEVRGDAAFLIMTSGNFDGQDLGHWAETLLQ